MSSKSDDFSLRYGDYTCCSRPAVVWLAVVQYYFRFRIRWCHSHPNVKIYTQTKFRRRNGWDITNSGFEKQTSAILEFFFRLPLLPYHSNRRDILHQTTKFHPNRTSLGDNMTSYWFSRWQPRRRNTTGFIFDDVTLFRRSTSIRKPNFIDIS